MNVHLCVRVYVPPVQLTPLIVPDAKVRRGQVDVHIMLEDLLKETLSLSQLELLCRVHIWEPLATLRLRWQSKQKNRKLDSSSDKGLYMTLEFRVQRAYKAEFQSNSTQCW